MRLYFIVLFFFGGEVATFSTIPRYSSPSLPVTCPLRNVHPLFSHFLRNFCLFFSCSVCNKRCEQNKRPTTSAVNQQGELDVVQRGSELWEAQAFRNTLSSSRRIREDTSQILTSLPFTMWNPGAHLVSEIYQSTVNTAAPNVFARGHYILLHVRLFLCPLNVQTIRNTQLTVVLHNILYDISHISHLECLFFP